MLEAAVQSVFQFADQHDIKVIMPPSGNVTTLGDKDKLAQVMANLIALGIASVPKASALHMAVSRKGTDVTIELVVTASPEDLALAARHDQSANASDFNDDRSSPHAAAKRGSDASASGAEGVSLSLSRAIIEKLGGTVCAVLDHDIRAVITVSFAKQPVELDAQVGTTG
jgi:signal transduction histidine kinase